MPVEVEEVAEEAARELGASREDVLEEGLRAFLEKRLKEMKVEIHEITSEYGVSSVEEFQDLYEEGDVEESESWRDLQRLDHLEYKRDRISQLLREMG